MQVAVHNGLGNGQLLDATRVVINDKYGNPLAVAIEIEDGSIFAATADDPRWNQILQQIGIKRVVVVDTMRAAPLDQIQFE